MSDSSTQDKRQAIFQSLEGEAEASPLSLRTYISQHMDDQYAEDPEPASQLAPPSNAYAKSEVQAKGPADLQVGMQLNSLDTDLAAGLERYLPTRITRLNTTKKRLVREIEALEQRTERLKAVESVSSDLHEKLEAYEARLLILKRHEAEVDAEIRGHYEEESQLFKISTAFHKVSNQFKEVSQSTFGKFIPADWLQKTDNQRFELIALNKELKNLTDVLQEEMDQQIPTSIEISHLINQYDQTLSQVEKLAEELQNRTSFWDRLNDKIGELYRKIYT